MPTTDNRIEWIDTARGLGLMAVFIGHLKVPYASAWVYTFHMPLFFFLSGLLYSGCEKYSFVQFACRRFKGLVIPYFTLGIVIVLFHCCLYAWHHEPSTTYQEMLRSFIVQEHYWTIWFLAALYLTQLIYYGIDWCFNRWKYAVSVASAVVCLYGLVRYRMGWGSLPWNLDIAFVSQFFFHLGYRFMQNTYFKEVFIFSRSYLQKLLIIVFCLVINIVAAKSCIVFSGHSLDMSIGMYGNEGLSFVSIIAGILMVVTFAPVINSKLITYLGCNTMILFSWHSRIIIVACSIFYDHYGLFQQAGRTINMLRALLTLFIILLILVPINEIIKRLSFHKFFGV